MAPTTAARRRRPALPGVRLAFGLALLYLSLIVLVPLAALALNATTMTWPRFVAAATSPRALASYRLTLSAAATAATVNAAFGLVVAWVLVRYRFPGRRIVDGLVDLPFAMPTAVAGIALTTVYAPAGWVGRWLTPLGLQVAFAPLGVIVALTFIGLPFVVRTVQPVLLDLDPEVEEAAASLGASRWETFRRVTFPALVPALVTGFALAFARALGEYGWSSSSRATSPCGRRSPRS